MGMGEKMNYKVSEKNVKMYGRTLENRGVLWCALSGTGIGFTFQGTKAVLHFRGDDSTFGNETEGKARVAIFVNGERTFDFMMKEEQKTVTVWESETVKEVIVEVIKISEAAMSTVGIEEIEAETVDGIHPLPKKKRKIEFIGDSITCGYGVDLEDPDTVFATDTEDVTKAYAYRAARLLDADYSMVSYSGYGVLSGYTDTDERCIHQLVPAYYEKVAFSYAHPFGTCKLEQQEWNFSRFCPDAIVVNLGTNDDSYCKDDAGRQQEFCNEYVKFLTKIRKHNKKAEIFCTVGVMGERIYPTVAAAVTEYMQKYDDMHIHVFPLKEQSEEDGRVTDNHPTARTHQKVAKAVARNIQTVMGW